MKNSKVFKTKIAGKEIKVEVGGYCGQANGSCMVTCGETVVMVNATMSKAPRDGVDFFPLSCDFEEKMYSVGRFPGGYKKREGRASDKAILSSRLLDRPLRPLFPDNWFNDVSVVATVLSVDPDYPPEIWAMVGSSIALSISDIPWGGPTGSVVVGLVDDKYVINPTQAERDKSILNLTLSGTKDAISMVEAGAQEVTEAQMVEAILTGHQEIKNIVKFIEKITKEVGKKKIKPDVVTVSDAIRKDVVKFADKKMDKVLEEFDRYKRDDAETELTEKVIEKFAEKYPEGESDIRQVLYDIKKEKVRNKILIKGIRPDGRKLTEIRPIWCEVDVLPRVHGTGVFTRGETQVLTTATLGTIDDVQRLDGLDDEVMKRYIHHYNFPGYSVGDPKPSRGPGRREIGHGALAERALEPVLPSTEEFPYAIRTVSEVLSSNGSTSQASVCGSTLALMDAGVPIKDPVAGIAMGLISTPKMDKIAVLTDIQGLEDFLGDMDFKVAGTKKGITAIQMDIKIEGITESVLKLALEQARIGRLEILDKMLRVLKQPRKTVSKYAPKIVNFEIDPDKIGEVIGSSGKTINKIIEETDAKINISDEGKVFIAGIELEKVEQARGMVEAICREYKVGDIITGEVVRIENYGAFVALSLVKDGMIHISKLDKKRVRKVEDIVNIGDKVKVEVIKLAMGKVDLRLVENLGK